MSVSQFRYKAFISYSHADKVWAEWLLKSLESYKVPKSLVGQKTDLGEVPVRLAPIFRDRDELPAAHRLTDRLSEALKASEFLIVLCSPRAAKSKLVNREIIEFKKTHGDGQVLCMIVDGMPFADNPEQECFPEALLHSFTEDGKKAGLSAEGLAADLRAEGDGKKLGLQKIVAGMIGVGLNDLVRREEQHRQRNMIAVTAAAFIGMSVMGALTYEASMARQEAEQLQTIAEEMSEISKMRRSDAESMAFFMLETAYYDLLKVGHLKSAEQIVTKVKNYYTEQDFDTLSPGQAIRLTGAMLRLGQTYDRQGHSDKAKEQFDQAFDIVSELIAQRPDEELLKFRMGIILFFRGYLAARTGDYQLAEADYRERLRLHSQQDIIPAHPNGPDTEAERRANAREQVADSQGVLADLLAGPLGNIEEALPLAEQSLATRKELAEAAPHSNRAYVDLASSYHYLGKIHMLRGAYDAALKAFRERQAIFDMLIEREPKNLRFKRRGLMTKQYIAKLLLQQGKTVESQHLMEAGASGFDLLTTTDPANTMWLADSGEAYINLAAFYIQTGQHYKAVAPLAVGQKQLAEALNRDNSRSKRRLASYKGHYLEAQLALAERRPEKANNLLAKVRESLNAEADHFHRMPQSLELEAKVSFLSGWLQQDLGGPEKAQETWLAFASRAENSPASLSPPTKAMLAQCYEGANMRDMARGIQAELEAMGYDEPILFQVGSPKYVVNNPQLDRRE
ncbi:TIR domain-containing protein [Kordiimonas lipolytica]|uniref:TIR domain-containing protein n=1 Tax=Kordiimonas lipolytica TaxID=1662421 RepID=A0ABV8UE85_9PROT|nr:toll/interleukin-1 receptor domain-containing protein [Kordiimonas lipolytica]